MSGVLTLLFLALLLLPAPVSAGQENKGARGSCVVSACSEPRLLPPAPNSCSRSYCRAILAHVDSLVRKNFYDRRTALSTWPDIVERHRASIVAASNLGQLSQEMNAAIRELKSSHCQFVTLNDETYYFLHTLFHSFPSRKGKKLPSMPMVFTGAVTGGVNASGNQVRYVLDGSPAAKAGIHIGDCISSVNGAAYTGQLSFQGTAGKLTALGILRNGKAMTITLKPLLRDDASMYVDAIGKSVRIETGKEGKIGYIHLWSGGTPAHEAFEEALGSKLQQTDGLIVDFRDGYGGNFFNDLDFFYRPPKGYPAFTTVDRSGKRDTSLLYYDKPLVVIINGGVRSGRELLAFSLKQTGRATLVGENTAGAVLAGRLFPIDDRCSLYLAVGHCDTGSEILEGKGVAADVEVRLSCKERGENDTQLLQARRILCKQLSEAASKD